MCAVLTIQRENILRWFGRSTRGLANRLAIVPCSAWALPAVHGAITGGRTLRTISLGLASADHSTLKRSGCSERGLKLGEFARLDALFCSVNMCAIPSFQR